MIVILWIQPEKGGGGGTTFTQDLAGSITGTGALAKSDSKPLAGSSTATGALTKLRTKPLAGSITGTGALTKLTAKSLAGSSTGSGALSMIKATLQALGGSITGTGALTKLAGKAAVGSTTGTGSLVRSCAKGLIGSSAAAGGLAKLITKPLAGSSTGSGALTRIKATLQSLAGSITGTGALTKTTSKALAGSVTGSGTLVRVIAKALAGSVTAAGALAKAIAKAAFTGSITGTGAATNQAGATVPPTLLPELVRRARPGTVALEQPGMPRRARPAPLAYFLEPVSAAYLVATTGTVTTPDPGTLPNECTFVCKVRGPTAGTGNDTIAAQYDADPQRAWLWRRTVSNGAQVWTVAPTGTAAGATSRTMTFVAVDTIDEHIALSVTVNNGSSQTVLTPKRSLDNGYTWLSSTSNTGSVLTPFDSTGVVRIGGFGVSVADPFDGRIYWVELRTGLDPTAGTVLWRYDASDFTPTAGNLSYVDPRGTTWTYTTHTAHTVETDNRWLRPAKVRRRQPALV